MQGVGDGSKPLCCMQAGKGKGERENPVRRRLRDGKDRREWVER